jgi:hypothetical protein
MDLLIQYLDPVFCMLAAVAVAVLPRQVAAALVAVETEKE